MKRKITIGSLLAIILIVAGYLFYLHSDPIINVSDTNADNNKIEKNFEKNKEKIDSTKVHYLENIPVVVKYPFC